MTRLLIVDDHAIVRAGVKRLLAAAADIEWCEAATGEDALALIAGGQIELVVLDLKLPGVGGLELIRRIRQAQPRTRILVFSTHTEPIYVSRTLEAGACGYVSKNAAPEELVRAIQTVLRGGCYVEDEIAEEIGGRETPIDDYLSPLTNREMEIMRLLSLGHSLRQIAVALGVAYKTVANTCTNIKEKLGVTQTADLIRISVDRDLV